MSCVCQLSVPNKNAENNKNLKGLYPLYTLCKGNKRLAGIGFLSNLFFLMYFSFTLSFTFIMPVQIIIVQIIVLLTFWQNIALILFWKVLQLMKIMNLKIYWPPHHPYYAFLILFEVFSPLLWLWQASDCTSQRNYYRGKGNKIMYIIFYAGWHFEGKQLHANCKYRW